MKHDTFATIINKHWPIITALNMLIIAGVSLYPAEHLPQVPGTDKTHHFIAYGLLAFPAAYAQPKNLGFILIMLCLFGGVIELIQPYANRYGEWLDFAANCGGVFTGYLLTALAKHLNSIKLIK